MNTTTTTTKPGCETHPDLDSKCGDCAEKECGNYVEQVILRKAIADIRGALAALIEATEVYDGEVRESKVTDATYHLGNALGQVGKYRARRPLKAQRKITKAMRDGKKDGAS